jgi:RimJ/RimL family protein N-acetyltransferase
MGATDPTNATARVLMALATLQMPVELDVVLGRAAPYCNEVASIIGTRGRLHIDPDDLPGLAAQADLAIGAGGTSSFERACLGLPSIITVLADNQRELAAAFAAVGAARTVVLADLDRPDRLAAALAALIGDAGSRREMSCAAAEIVDGRGPQRLLLELANRRPPESGSVRLRLSEASDRDWLLALQTRPETRRFARNPRPPSPAEHHSWFGRTLDDPDRLLAIVEWKRTPAGMLRVDRKTGEQSAFEVSIAVTPEFHGRGIGSAALAILRKALPKAELTATVLAGNRASQTMFERAGYCREGEERYRSRVA